MNHTIQSLFSCPRPKTTRVASPAAVLLVVCLVLTACTTVVPRQPAVQNIFVLNPELKRQSPDGLDRKRTIVVTPPRAAPGFDTPRIAYVPRPNEISYYANSQWADTPSRMLEPLLVRALEETAGFQAVVQATSPVAGDLRLDTEIIHLQQEFLSRPSRLRLTLRAQVVDLKQRRVLATQVFDAVEEAPSDDAYGGALAANRALKKVLEKVAGLSADQGIKSGK